MPTKYVLHGGMPHRPNLENDAFVREVLKDLANDVKILLVYFAQGDENIEYCTTQDTTQFNKNKGSKKLTFEVAKIDTFVQQIRTSDVIFFRGGDTLKLIDTLKQLPDLERLFVDKVVAGESAGVYALSSYFYSKSLGGVFKGLGLVPFKTICHYIGENRDKLSDCPENIEYLLLSNYEHKVFQVNTKLFTQN